MSRHPSKIVACYLLILIVLGCSPPAPPADPAAQSDLAQASPRTPGATVAQRPAQATPTASPAGRSQTAAAAKAPATFTATSVARTASAAAPPAPPAPSATATPLPDLAATATQVALAAEATRVAQDAGAAATQIALLTAANATQAAQIADAGATQTAVALALEATRVAERASRNATVSQAVTAPVQPTVSTFEVFEQVRPAVIHIIAEDATGRWTGTGLIIHPDGFIVTNNHVVQGAQRLIVSLADGRLFAARLVRSHPLAGAEIFTLADPLKVDYDLAVLKIEATGLPYGVLADSNQVRELEEVIAIGYPLNYVSGGPTVTTGNVSAKRPTAFGGPLLIQMTTTINPGNSGGPLVNRAGQVIGITTWSDRRQGATGVNFAISANDVRDFLADRIRPEAIAAAAQFAASRR
ncbi:MAG TPA: trypsin-like peptidase domain-containing protein [Dehalococcoidia bacterium]|nr:trypsin-like peptidase domain-containing protein [Dehalococcoidia bacterium]